MNSAKTDKGQPSEPEELRTEATLVESGIGKILETLEAEPGPTDWTPTDKTLAAFIWNRRMVPIEVAERWGVKRRWPDQTEMAESSVLEFLVTVACTPGGAGQYLLAAYLRERGYPEDYAAIAERYERALHRVQRLVIDRLGTLTAYAEAERTLHEQGGCLHTGFFGD